ncbi:tripartite tricarboxylate transporter permease [Psychromarinibacter sp. C21-152]|uniref:Tripartite tricarboxylate transporter permease n=1 Tax=Psychromarinibacter sediminicola TaxID=3033385 RepID=A0AAE3NV17_9RHOB|nr:tripartite tricarboxylate transporter permease [Psychromarinibacter sediminicola]MDF0601142.1 tripartite tricarboxylate transporter permease [Psychromarinibacter sediminicola]
MSDTFLNLGLGFQTALSLENLMFCMFGVTLGTFVGVLPGIGALATISMCLPLTFYLDPVSAIIMLAGIFYGAQYGSSTASILLNLPGSAPAAVTCLDGYPMAQQGRSGVALFLTTIASFIGGSFSIMLMIVFAPMLASVAISFSSAEYFSIMVLALVAASTLSNGSFLKGVTMTAVGILLGLVGTDISSGTARFTFGSVTLSDGISLVALAMGLFGISEILTNLSRGNYTAIDPRSITLRSLIPTRADMRRFWPSSGRGTLIGSVVGILPGTGPTIATFMSYAAEKRIAKDSSIFGKGAIEGVAAPESANNSSVQAAFIPTLTLGIPGDAIMAVMLGALMLHGITPGPQLIINQPELFWGVIASFWIGNLFLLVLNIPMIGLWVRLLTVPYHILYPAMLFFICIGVYSVNNSSFDVLIALIFGVLGYGMMKFGFSPAPLLLGFVLGPLLEEHFRRALLLSRGDLTVFVMRPVSLLFLALTLLVLLLSMRWFRTLPRRFGRKALQRNE